MPKSPYSTPFYFLSAKIWQFDSESFERIKLDREPS